MRRKPATVRRQAGLPRTLRRLFWEYDFDQLSWDADQDLVIQRILTNGTWDAICWLRKRLGDPALRDWLERHRGARLDPRRLRFWELVLRLPRREVDAWVARALQSVWHRRHHS